jgi:Cdc6-like AAA superfamily ATPase
MVKTANHLLVKSILQNRLNSLPLIGLEDQFNQLLNLVQDTVVRGKGNSVLLQGPHGSGKTSVLKRVFSTLNSQDYYTLYLDGIGRNRAR